MEQLRIRCHQRSKTRGVQTHLLPFDFPWRHTPTLASWHPQARWLPAIWIIRAAVEVVANTIAVTITVIAVHDDITVEITVRTIKTWLIPRITRTVVVREAVAIMLTVRIEALPVPFVIASTIIEA